VDGKSASEKVALLTRAYGAYTTTKQVFLNGIGSSRKGTCLARSSRSHLRVSSHKGILYYEFIAQGQMVNQQCYLEVTSDVMGICSEEKT
jgi:hypothetical protein